MTPIVLYMLWRLFWRSVVPMLMLSGRVLAWVSCLCAPVLWAAWFLGFVAACAMSAEAGWFSWPGSTPPKPDTTHLERAAEVARDAAQAATQAVESQARQASSQAEQNARVAELLGQLSAERENLAGRCEYLAELELQDSQWAAALNASGPVVVCVAGLGVACLALWLVSRPGSQLDLAPDELASAMEVLFEEAGRERVSGPMAAHAGPSSYPGSLKRLTGSNAWPERAGVTADDAPPEGSPGAGLGLGLALDPAQADLEPAGEQMPF